MNLGPALARFPAIGGQGGVAEPTYGAISFVATSAQVDQQASGTARDIVVNKPAGVAAGDIMFTIIQGAFGQADQATLAGWTKVLGKDTPAVLGMVLFYKVAGASEPDTYTWLNSNIWAKVNARCLAWRGQAAADFIHDTSNTAYVTNDATIRANDIVTTVPCSVLFFGCSYSGYEATLPTTPTGFTNRYQGGYPFSDTVNVGADYAMTTPGALGNVDSTLHTASATKHAFAVALACREL